MDKEKAMAIIMEAYDTGEVDGTEVEELDEALAVFDASPVADFEEFAAALSYFLETAGYEDGDTDTMTVDEFAAVVSEVDYALNNDYTFVDTDNYFDVGMSIFYRETGANLSDWLEDYVDFERIGEDHETDAKGKFTRYGYFAPKDF